MIDIKNIDGSVLFSVLPDESSVFHEELMTSDYVKLSWDSDVYKVIPAGAYIEYEGEKYKLLDNYSPTQQDECTYQYTPQFQSRVMNWDKQITPVYTYEEDGTTVKSREMDWEFTGSPADAMYIVKQAIKNETGEEWTIQLADSLPATITISSQSASIFATLNTIAGECDTEWWADKKTNTLYLSKCIFGDAVTLEVGDNVQVPTVTNDSEGYFTRFYAYGSTRNITQDYEGGQATNSIVNKRLTLNPTKYPNGYKDIKEGLKQDEVFVKVLYFDKIYPSSKLTISDVRARLKYRLDNNGQKIRIGGTDEEPIYEQYAIWYFQIEGFTFDESSIIEGLNLSASFESGQLASRDFELTYHKTASTVNDAADVTAFNIKAGDYEIVIDESSGTIIPGTSYIIPQDGDSLVLFNIIMPDEYVTSAQDELEKALDKAMLSYTEDNNSYQMASDPTRFYENETDIQMGQAVTFVNGSKSLSTRVQMVDKRLDLSCYQTIKVGNKIIKGNTQQLKDEVASVNQNLDVIKAFNELSASLSQAYANAQREMIEGFAAIKNLWSLETDEHGNKYAYTEYDIFGKGGITAYTSGKPQVPSIFDGLPLDNVTIWKNPSTGLIEVIGGTGGGGGSDFDSSKMWALLGASTTEQINKSHLTTALSGYAIKSELNISNWDTAYSWGNHANAGYAKQTSLDAVSDKLNDFLEGSDTDTIINKWKELEAFLSGMSESDNLAEILSTKADKSYVDTELKKYVTLSTEQTISGIKHFTNGLSVGSGKHKLYEENGVIYLDGDLAVKGGITTYAVSNSEISTVMDGVAVDGVTIKKENGVLIAIGGSGSSFDKSAMWAALLASTTEQINKSHLTTALTGYATESWVTGKNYAVKATTLAGYGITDAYTKTEANNRYVNISGDTMQGDLVIPNGKYLFGVSESSGAMIFFDGTKTVIGSAGESTSAATHIRSKTGHATIGTANTGTYKIWDSGNDGSGSGLNADLLDGKHDGEVSGFLNTKQLPYTNADKVNWWCKIATIKITAQYTSKQSLLLITDSYTTYTSSVYGFVYIKVQQQSSIGNIPNVTLRVFGSIPKSNIEGRLTLTSTSSDLDIYFKETLPYQRGYISFVQGEDIRNVGELIQKLPTATRNILCDNDFRAGRLETARTIWGRTFDGTANVSGQLDGVTNINGTGTFTSANTKVTDSIYINGIRMYKSADGTIKIDGNLLVTGGITAYSTGEEGGGSSGGLDVDLMWEILGGTGTQQINKSHLTTALSGYLTSVSLATISDLNSGWDSLLKNAPSVYVTRHPTISEVTNKQSLVIKLNSGATEGTNMFTYNATSAKTVNITPSAIGAATSGHNHALSILTDLNSGWDALLKAAPSAYVTRWPSISEVTSKQNLIVKLNGGTTEGTNQFTYNATAAKTINITPSGIGAAASSHNHSWANITSGKPTTLSGYGITDAYTKTECNSTFVNVSGDTITGSLSFSPNDSRDLKPYINSSVEKNRTYLNFVAGDDADDGFIFRINYYNDSNTENRKRFIINWNGVTSKASITAPSFNGSLNGNASSSSKLQTPRTINGTNFDGTANITTAKWGTARTITLGSYLSGSVSVDGSANITLNANVIGLTSQGRKTAISGTTIPSSGVRLYEVYSNGYPTSYGNLLSVKGWGSGELLLAWKNTNRIYYRSKSDVSTESWTSWSTVAFLTDNVASATKLQTTRTLWGQNFDGQQNVSGSLSGVSNISANGTLTSSYSSGTYVNALKNSVINCNISSFGGWIRGNTKNGRITLATYPGADNRLYFGYAEQSKIDAGTNSFTHEMVWVGDTGGLIVKGDILAQGGITCYSSDERAKTIIEEISLSLKQIAESPTIRFKWNGWNIKDDGKTHIGGIAQYVQKILPECVLDADGVLNMDYATTAYIYSVQTARHLQKYETKTDKEIRNLKKRVLYLENKLKQLGYEESDTLVN